MQVYIFAWKQVCKYAWMKICKYASKYANMQVYTYLAELRECPDIAIYMDRLCKAMVSYGQLMQSKIKI